MRPQHQIFMQQHGNQQRMPTQFGHMNNNNMNQGQLPPQQAPPPPQQQRPHPNVHTTPDKSMASINPEWRQTAIMSQSINFNDNENNLEFLDNLSAGDPSNYDLLNSFESENFNFLQ